MEEFARSAADSYFKTDCEKVRGFIMELIADSNISLQMVSSSPFKSLCLRLIELGQRNPERDPDDLLYRSSRTSIRTDFAIWAAAKTEECWNTYKSIRYASMTADAGTIIHKPFLLTSIASPELNVRPLVIHVWGDFTGTLEAYKDAIRADICQCEAHGVIVSGIVTDHCAVQVCSVSHESRASVFKEERNVLQLQQLQNDPELLRPRKVARWIGCACHSANLALSDLEKDNSDFSMMVSHLKNASEFLHGKPVRSRLRRSGGPAYCKTRWTNVCDIARWMTKHTAVLLDFTLKFPTLFDDDSKLNMFLDALCYSRSLLVLLAGYAALVHELSGDHTPAAHILLLLENACQMTAKLVEQHCPDIEPLACHLISCLVGRFRGAFPSGKDAPLLQLLNLLCPAGRKRFREKATLTRPDLIQTEPETAVISPKIVIDTDTMDLIRKDPEDYQPKLTEIRSYFAEARTASASGSDMERTPFEEDADAFDRAVEEMEQEDRAERHNNGEEEDFAEEEEEIQEGEEDVDEASEDFEYSVEDIIPDDADRQALSELKKILDDMGLPGQIKADTMKYMKWWLFAEAPAAVLKTFSCGSLLAPWKAQESFPFGKVMCEIAARLLSIVSSEATCERGFWYLRRLLAPHRMNSSNLLLEQRLRAQVSFPPIVETEEDRRLYGTRTFVQSTANRPEDILTGRL
jgi:hypothetical protein